MRKRKGKKSVESRTNNRQKDQKEQRVQKKEKSGCSFFLFLCWKKVVAFFSFSLSCVEKNTPEKQKIRESFVITRAHISSASRSKRSWKFMRTRVCVCMFFVCIFSSKFLKTEEIRLLFLCVFWGGLEKVRQTTPDQKRRNERKKRRRKNWFVFALFSLSLPFFLFSFFLHSLLRALSFTRVH